MRFFPVLLAILLGALLLTWVIEREWLYAQFGIEAAPTEAKDVISEDDGVTAQGVIRVVTRSSEAQMIDGAVILRGETAAMRQVDVRAETSSTVVSEPIRKGSYVEAGQELCVLDPGTRESSAAEARARLLEARARAAEAESKVPEAQARVAEAEARLDEALANENAAVKLAADGFASDTRVKNARAAVAAARAGVQAAQAGLSTAQSGIESAKAGIESADAAIAAAEKEIDRLTIKAPFGGLLESDTAELGALLQPGALCATVIQLDPIKLVGYVPETSVSRIEVGAMAGARLASSGDLQVQGRVTFLSRSADPTTRTFRVEIEVPNPEQAIRDGQTAEILIASQGEMAHLLPASALTLNDEGTLGVRTVETGNIVRFKPVRVLRDTTQGVWLSGLAQVVDVIVTGQEFVTDGVVVAPTNEEPET